MEGRQRTRRSALSVPSPSVVSRHPLIVLALLLALVVGVRSAAAQSRGEKTLLMPGVTYERDVEFTLHGPVVLHVLTAPRPDGSLYRLQPMLSNNAVVATEPLTAMEKDVSGQATAAGINGDYFNPNPGDPKSMLLTNGVLVSPPALSAPLLARLA